MYIIRLKPRNLKLFVLQAFKLNVSKIKLNELYNTHSSDIVIKSGIIKAIL